MKCFTLVLCVLFSDYATAQYTAPQQQVAPEQGESDVDFAVGVGLDYGGLGASLSFLPDQHIALFGSVGYAVAGAGYNFGAKFRYNPHDRFCFTSGYMYGYNGAIKVTGFQQTYQKLYYGSSIFIGGDIRPGSGNQKNYLSIEIILPFRDPAFQRDIDNFRSAGVSISNPLPVLVSAGYHLGF